jgi:hypothetical protein
LLLYCSVEIKTIDQNNNLKLKLIGFVPSMSTDDIKPGFADMSVSNRSSLKKFSEILKTFSSQKYLPFGNVIICKRNENGKYGKYGKYGKSESTSKSQKELKKWKENF